MGVVGWRMAGVRCWKCISGRPTCRDVLISDAGPWNGVASVKGLPYPDRSGLGQFTVSGLRALSFLNASVSNAASVS